MCFPPPGVTMRMHLWQEMADIWRMRRRRRRSEAPIHPSSKSNTCHPCLINLPQRIVRQFPGFSFIKKDPFLIFYSYVKYFFYFGGGGGGWEDWGYLFSFLEFIFWFLSRGEAPLRDHYLVSNCPTSTQPDNFKLEYHHTTTHALSWTHIMNSDVCGGCYMMILYLKNIRLGWSWAVAQWSFSCTPLLPPPPPPLFLFLSILCVSTSLMATLGHRINCHISGKRWWRAVYCLRVLTPFPL